MTPVDVARAAFLRACELDVAVRKPGNVSLASAGHGMQARHFLAAAQAAAGPLLKPGARVGERIEGAVAASWAAAGCNTNLGIVLLCAPLAAAFERGGDLAAATHAVLQALDVEDARAAFRAIVQANPGGLGRAEQADVHAAPAIDLGAAMALAAGRDSIARQYAEGFREVLEAAQGLGFALSEGADPRLRDAAVQRVYLGWLARWPDSHIVRKHGEALAQIVMSAAQAWQGRDAPGDDPAFAAWDESLKQQALNPGTSADLTVATLFAAGLQRAGGMDRDSGSASAG